MKNSESFNNKLIFVQSFLESKKPAIIVVMLIYLLSMIFTSPTRHGADRFYLLALDIIKHRSVNIQRLVDDQNHYAMVSVDVFNSEGVRYIGVHPGQAFWGTPGLAIYYFTKHFNNFSHEISIKKNANEKYDFVLGSFAMNSTTSALFTAVASLFFIYIVAKANSHLNSRMSSIYFFVLLFYLATPLFYYSTHIIENQTESCLVFIALGTLCLDAIIDSSRLKKLNYFLSGFIIGLAFLTNFSSIILLPFAFLHVSLNGFVIFDFRNHSNFFRNLWKELIESRGKKIVGMTWIFLGWVLPTLLLLFYQYLLFSNPFKSVYTFLVELPQTSSPTLIDYIKAFVVSLGQYMFSPKVGLFSYTPILLFPLFVYILSFMTRKQSSNLEINNQASSLNVSLFRTMLIIQPLYIVFYTLFAAVHFVDNNELISNYNIYSARHLLPIVFPMGYILFDSLVKMNRTETMTRWTLWFVLIILWIFSLANNISATLIGDWIFGLNQTWDYIHRLSISDWNLMSQRRMLVDW